MRMQWSTRTLPMRTPPKRTPPALTGSMELRGTYALPLQPHPYRTARMSFWGGCEYPNIRWVHESCAMVKVFLLKPVACQRNQETKETKKPKKPRNQRNQETKETKKPKKPRNQGSSTQPLETVLSNIASLYAHEGIHRLQSSLFDSEVGVVLLLCSHLPCNPSSLEVAYSALIDKDAPPSLVPLAKTFSPPVLPVAACRSSPPRPTRHAFIASSVGMYVAPGSPQRPQSSV